MATGGKHHSWWANHLWTIFHSYVKLLEGTVPSPVFFVISVATKRYRVPHGTCIKMYAASSPWLSKTHGEWGEGLQFIMFLGLDLGRINRQGHKFISFSFFLSTSSIFFQYVLSRVNKSNKLVVTTHWNMLHTCTDCIDLMKQHVRKKTKKKTRSIT